jgi:sulfatase modifying factor 1
MEPEVKTPLARGPKVDPAVEGKRAVALAVAGFLLVIVAVAGSFGCSIGGSRGAGSKPEEPKQVKDKAPAVEQKVSRRTKSVRGLIYVWVEPGSFRMGCSAGDDECRDNEKPAHPVTLSHGFWMGETEVTQDAYQQVIGSNPSESKSERLPVESVTWKEAQGYCQAAGMRLPTEAEWEYAARGGESAPKYGDIESISWYAGNSNGTAHEGRTREPNRFGLYDMFGNVWEWVADRYGSYSDGPETDPKGPSAGQERILRGGCWGDISRVTRASFRNRVVGPGYYSSGAGLRCAGD